MRTILSLLALALLGGCLNAPIGADPGDRAPSFEITDTEFHKVRLSDYTDKPVVLFFFSVACRTCAGETTRELVPLEEDLGDAVGFVSVNIGLDESRPDILAFKNETGADWPHAWDADYVAQRYGVYAPSTVVVIDRDHRLVDKELDPDRAWIESKLGL